MAKPMTLDHLRSAKKPVIRTVRIAGDTELLERREALQTRFDRLSSRRGLRPDGDEKLDQDLQALAAEIEDLTEQIDESILVFKFRSIGSKRYERLITDNPPTDEQIAEAKSKGLTPPDFNIDEFGPQLISACLMEPVMTPDEVRELILDNENWTAAEIGAISEAAVQVNIQRRIPQMGNG